MIERQSLRAVAAVAAAFFFAACAASLAANKRSPGSVTNGEFKPSRPPQASYGPDPLVTCPDHGINGALEEALKLQMHEKAPPQDGRLCAIADTLLGWPTSDKNEMPPEVVRAFLSQYFGLPASFRNVIITTVDNTKDDEVASVLVDNITSFAATAQAPRWGLFTELQTGGSSRERAAQAAAGNSTGGKTHLALVMYDENLVLDPLPRRLAANSSATLNGHLAGSLKSPRIQVVDVLGKLEKGSPSEGQAVHAEIKCGDKPGKILVQILADADGGDVVVANFPVACATEPAVSVRLPGSEGPIDPAGTEKKLAETLNSDRASVGLKPLNVSESLTRIARGIAEGQAKNKGVTSNELMAQLKEADIATPLILESAASGFSTEGIASKLADSPPDRASAMRADITDVGVGATKGPDVGGKPTMIVIELFVTQLPPPDPQAIKSKLYAAINSKREAAGKSKVEKDSVLDEIAQKYADAAVTAGGPVPREKESEIMAPLYKASMTVNEVGGFVPNEETAINVSDQGTVLGEAKLVGVGVAVGRSPQFGKNSPFVMVLLGTRHAPAKAVPKKKRH